MCDFGKRGFKHTFLQMSAASLEKVTAGHEKQVPSLMILVHF